MLLVLLLHIGDCLPDLSRMYQLVSRIPDGLGELKTRLESHICAQGLTALEKCGEAALNVRTTGGLVWGVYHQTWVQFTFVDSNSCKFIKD